MFFGLCNSPGTFQAFMDEIFYDLKTKGYCIIYMDDILIFSIDPEHHRRAVREVLKVLRKHKLYLKAEKCEFHKTEMEFLGFIVGNGQVRMDEGKVNVVKQWKSPQNKKDLQTFLGFANFYRKFIKDFAKSSLKITPLTGKKEWNWGTEQEEAFREIIDKMCREPVLWTLKDHGKMRIEVDGSGHAMGAVLMQEQDGDFRAITHHSETYNAAEWNYHTEDREMLAIMMMLKKWRHYLQGRPTFEIWTDHRNLQTFRKPQNINRQQARWITDMQEFDFTIHHIEGKKNIRADALSRQDREENKKGDNLQEIILPEHLFRTLQAHCVRVVAVNSQESSERVRNPDYQDFEIRQMEIKSLEEETGDQESNEEDDLESETEEEELPSNVHTCGQHQGLDEECPVEITPKTEFSWMTEESFIGMDLRQITVESTKEKEVILQKYHDEPLASHPGTKRMMKELEKEYIWKGMREDVKKYTKGCVPCQQNITVRKKKTAPLHPMPIETQPWGRISVDIIGPLPESLTYDAILVIVDYFTKMKILIPTNTELTSLGTAELFKNYAFKRFGMPRGVVSDRGTQFVSDFMTELYKVLGIKGLPSTAYHPQTDGQTERVNQEIETYLRFYVNFQQDDWAKWLDQAEFVLNARFHEVIQETPFFMMHGYHPWKGDEKTSQKSPGATEWAERLTEAQKRAEVAMEKAQEAMKRYYDRNRLTDKKGNVISLNLEAGDKVWVDGRNLKTFRPTKKMDVKRLGPFVILEKIGSSAYRLKLPQLWSRVHPVFNEILLTPYHEPEFPSQVQPEPPGPIDVEGYPIYEIEAILEQRKWGRGSQYLVSWKGYGWHDNTWEPASHLRQDVPEMLEEFSSQK